MRPSLLLLASLVMPAAASAAPVAIAVIGADGKPLAGAVVQVRAARAPTAASAFPGPFVVAQKAIAFQPHMLIVPVGATVSFPNRDKVRHHVYSFSAAKTFELKLYGREEARVITFDRAGVVALGCNIHDVMSGFIIVVDTPWAAETDARGRVVFDIPTGTAKVSVWHPSIRGPGNTLAQSATVGAQGLSTSFTLRR